MTRTSAFLLSYKGKAHSSAFFISFLANDTSCCHICICAVAAAQARNGNAICSAVCGMDIVSIAHVNTNVANGAIAASIEEYQIPSLQIRLGNRYTIACHRSGTSIQRNTEITENSIYKAGTIHTCIQVCATPYIRSTDKLFCICNNFFTFCGRCRRNSGPCGSYRKMEW